MHTASILMGTPLADGEDVSASASCCSVGAGLPRKRPGKAEAKLPVLEYAIQITTGKCVCLNQPRHRRRWLLMQPTDATYLEQ